MTTESTGRLAGAAALPAAPQAAPDARLRLEEADLALERALAVLRLALPMIDGGDAAARRNGAVALYCVRDYLEQLEAKLGELRAQMPRVSP